jgi:hypothetical protein
MVGPFGKPSGLWWSFEPTMVKRAPAFLDRKAYMKCPPLQQDHTTALVTGE